MSVEIRCPVPEDVPGGPPLIDNHNRPITYLRLAITDRCNLRCRYCRPEEGVPFIPHDDILRFEEMERLVTIFAGLGVTKVRVTGGEPFSRRGAMGFLKELGKIDGIDALHVTTNGVKTARYLDELKEIGIAGINLSLDTLDPKRFRRITRRDYLNGVLETLHGALDRDIPLKVNSVILEDTSDQEIRSLARLAENHPITLRFIERMPFSGASRTREIANGDLVGRLQRIFPTITEEIPGPHPATARIFSIGGFRGKLGLIQGYSRLFCRTCNKVRITPAGMLKTCLYDNGALDLRALVRSGETDFEIGRNITGCIRNRYVNGLAAEDACGCDEEPSMSVIGG
ncbi:MAG: GTP 3',8-cyclase MoaA [Proteobacteria bacterium]|nr:GTP 3',8-cyclase MoaA [Pseudomonadota bacterium]